MSTQNTISFNGQSTNQARSRKTTLRWNANGVQWCTVQVREKVWAVNPLPAVGFPTDDTVPVSGDLVISKGDVTNWTFPGIHLQSCVTTVSQRWKTRETTFSYDPEVINSAAFTGATLDSPDVPPPPAGALAGYTASIGGPADNLLGAAVLTTDSAANVIRLAGVRTGNANGYLKALMDAHVIHNTTRGLLQGFRVQCSLGDLGLSTANILEVEVIDLVGECVHDPVPGVRWYADKAPAGSLIAGGMTAAELLEHHNHNRVAEDRGPSEPVQLLNVVCKPGVHRSWKPA